MSQHRGSKLVLDTGTRFSRNRTELSINSSWQGLESIAKRGACLSMQGFNMEMRLREVGQPKRKKPQSFD
ncbi:hypothetical protein D8S93_24690 [Vibrio sp. VGrn 2]|nr:hypothetical protein [Vibrio sp. VGrn 2]